MQLEAYFDKKSPKDGPPTKELVTPDALGIEIELENIPPGCKGYLSANWENFEDHSLRNNGNEFRFHKPLGGSTAVGALRELEGMFTALKHTPSVSARASTHIHINMGNVDEAELIKFCATYLLFERAIFRAFSPARESNHFCVPLAQCDEVLGLLGKFNKDKSWENFLLNVREVVGRYGAFNLQALNKFNTIEFRHFPGEYRAERVIEWCNILLALKRFAMTDKAHMSDVLADLSLHGYDNFAYRVFPMGIAAKLIKVNNFDSTFHNSIRVVQSILVPAQTETPEIVKSLIEEKRKKIAEKKKQVKADFYQKMEAARGLLREQGKGEAQQEEEQVVEEEEPKLEAVEVDDEDLPNYVTRVPRFIMDHLLMTVIRPKGVRPFDYLFEVIKGRIPDNRFGNAEAVYYNDCMARLNEANVNMDVY